MPKFTKAEITDSTLEKVWRQLRNVLKFEPSENMPEKGSKHALLHALTEKQVIRVLGMRSNQTLPAKIKTCTGAIEAARQVLRRKNVAAPKKVEPTYTHHGPPCDCPTCKILKTLSPPDVAARYRKEGIKYSSVMLAADFASAAESDAQPANDNHVDGAQQNVAKNLMRNVAQAPH